MGASSADKHPENTNDDDHDEQEERKEHRHVDFIVKRVLATNAIEREEVQLQKANNCEEITEWCRKFHA